MFSANSVNSEIHHDLVSNKLHRELKYFFAATTRDEAHYAANQIEQLLSNRFIDIDTQSPIHLIAVATLGDAERMALFSMWRRYDIAIEKILFRFGDMDFRWGTKNLPINFVADIVHKNLFWCQPDLNESMRRQVILKEVVRAKYLAQTDKNVKSAYTRADVETYLADNLEALACTDELPFLADTFSNIVMKRFIEHAPADAAAFLQDFFCNADYAFGMFAITRLKKSLFGAAAKSVALSPLITLLRESVNTVFTVDEAIHLFQIHFPAVEDLPQTRRLVM